MQLADFIALMEQIAPPELACDFDNPGLIIGTEKRTLTGVLVALDCTLSVAREAVETGVELVLTHHPLLFSPVRRIWPDDPLTAAAYALIRGGVGLYAAHTNLDSAAGGVNDALSELLRLTDVVPYEGGMGRIGTLQEAMTLADFVRLTNRVLDTRAQFAGDSERIVTRVAVLGGAGGDSYLEARAMGADVLLTGEMKHNQVIEAQAAGIAAVVGGHYETERIVLPRLISRLQSAGNDVQYRIAHSDTAPLAQL